MDTPNFNARQLNTLRRIFHAMNHFMVWMWKLGLGRMINCWPAGFGRIMVIKNIGRRTGREYTTPVNYAPVRGEIYCLSGFGATSDWYRNIVARPQVELWLPDGKHRACAEDVSDSPDRLILLRQIIRDAGFAGPLFGVNEKKLSDEQLAAIAKDYRLLHFKQED